MQVCHSPLLNHLAERQRRCARSYRRSRKTPIVNWPIAQTAFCSCVDACCIAGLGHLQENLHVMAWTGLVRLPLIKHPSNPSLMPKQDLLNRMSSLESAKETVHVMKYIFPRQFGLKHVFSGADDGGGCQFRSDKSRDEEIMALGVATRLRRHQIKGDGWREDARVDLKLPKRLRGQAMELVQRLRNCHSRCAYAKLLQYYCPEVSNRAIYALPSPLTFPAEWALEAQRSLAHQDRR